MQESLKVFEEVKAAVKKWKQTIAKEMGESPDTFYLAGLDMARQGFELHIERAEGALEHQRITEADYVKNSRSFKREFEHLVPGRLDDVAFKPWLFQ